MAAAPSASMRPNGRGNWAEMSDAPPPSLPSGPVAPLPADVNRQVAAEQLRLIYEHMTVGTFVATVFGLMLVVHLHGRVPLGPLLGWAGLKVGVALPRILQSRLYRLRGRPGTAAWQRWTLGLLAVDGACWGLGGAWLMGGATDMVAVVAASLCCVASVATFGLQVRLGATAAYVVPMIAPTALALLWRDDRFGLFAGVGLLLFLGLMLSTARRSEKRLAEVFALRFLTDRISAERAQALELAQRQSAVKTKFLTAMSHELRTPLHGILGLTRVTRAHQHDEKLRHRLGLIEHSGEHLLQLINDLLDMSRIEAGRIELHESSFDLQAEVDELVDIYLVRTQEKGLLFNAAVDLPVPCWVMGDVTRLRQVLHNLLGNALKFTERGSIELRVQRSGAARVEFSVQDTGEGIAQADLAHIFDPFWQAGQTPLQRASGSGLGLSIARDIAQAMGGHIHCASELGRGSVFVLNLPLLMVDPPGDLAQRESGWMVGDISLLPGHVLLVEDNEVNALVVQAMLSRSGCEVQHVTNGEEAVRLATLGGRRPNVVLMDCQMPVLDGLEATRRIRALEQRLGLSRVPIVALTANTSSDDRLECERAGMDQFLGKPFTEKELLAAIGAYAQREPT